MCFISFGFLLATICVWVWMVCSLHSVTTGSRDRANVTLIIIIRHPTYASYLKENQTTPRPCSRWSFVSYDISLSSRTRFGLATTYYIVVVVVVVFTLTDRASTIPSNIRGCQSGTWLPIRYVVTRGTKVNGSHHGDNPLLRPWTSVFQFSLFLYDVWP